MFSFEHQKSIALQTQPYKSKTYFQTSQKWGKYISKLHENGVLQSFDLKSYDEYESCLLGKNDQPFT